MNSVVRIAAFRPHLKRLIFSLAFLSFVFLATDIPKAFADTPVWSFKGAKWYSLMETGNVTVGSGTTFAPTTRVIDS